MNSLLIISYYYILLCTRNFILLIIAGYKEGLTFILSVTLHYKRRLSCKISTHSLSSMFLSVSVLMIRNQLAEENLYTPLVTSRSKIRGLIRLGSATPHKGIISRSKESMNVRNERKSSLWLRFTPL